MKVLEIKDIIRKDVPIYYRMFFSGIAVLDMMNKLVERPIDFSIEIKPTGQKEILVTMGIPVDYPLVPLIKELKQFIDKLDSRGSLPL
ncbi:MAG: hypothetical protein LBQ30_06515 [Treponema sp.]|jgi:hypothetical protein|nr:hypothetical protein [Treponema sp.]